MAKTKLKTTTETETLAQSQDSVPETPAAEQPVPSQLTLSDLQILGRIIDLAARRGAFQATELSQVGDAYNKLAAFLAYADSAAKADSEATGEETPSEDKESA